MSRRAENAVLLLIGLAALAILWSRSQGVL